MRRAELLILCVLYMNTVSSCELFGKFSMRSLFKAGDIMIGGIFPIFNKEISSSSTFEREPPGVICKGYDLKNKTFPYLCLIILIFSNFVI